MNKLGKDIEKDLYSQLYRQLSWQLSWRVCEQFNMQFYFRPSLELFVPIQQEIVGEINSHENQNE